MTLKMGLYLHTTLNAQNLTFIPVLIAKLQLQWTLEIKHAFSTVIHTATRLKVSREGQPLSFRTLELKWQHLKLQRKCNLFSMFQFPKQIHRAIKKKTHTHTHFTHEYYSGVVFILATSSMLRDMLMGPLLLSIMGSCNSHIQGQILSYMDWNEHNLWFTSTEALSTQDHKTDVGK